MFRTPSESQTDFFRMLDEKIAEVRVHHIFLWNIRVHADSVALFSPGTRLHIRSVKHSISLAAQSQVGSVYSRQPA